MRTFSWMTHLAFPTGIAFAALGLWAGMDLQDREIETPKASSSHQLLRESANATRRPASDESERLQRGKRSAEIQKKAEFQEIKRLQVITQARATEEIQRQIAAKDKNNEENLIAEAEAEKQRREWESIQAQKELVLAAKASALRASEPWRELLSIALLQHGLQDYAGMRDSFDRAHALSENLKNPSHSGYQKLLVVQTALRAKEYDLALTYANQISAGKAQDLAYLALSTAYAQKGDFTTARTLSDVLNDEELKAKALHELAKEQAKAFGSRASAQTISLICHARLQDQTLRQVALFEAKAGRGQQARKLLDLCKSEQVRALALADLVKYYGSQADDGNAQQLLKIISPGPIEQWARAELAKAQIKLRQMHLAEQTASLLPEGPLADRVRVEMAIQAAKMSQMNKAVQVAMQIQDPMSRAYALKDLCLLQASMSGSSSGQRHLSMIDIPDTKNSTLGALALSDWRSGNQARALMTIRGINDPTRRVFFLMRLADAEWQANLPDSALRLIRLADNDLAQISEIQGRAVIAKMIELKAKLGQLDDGLKEMQQLTELEFRDKVLVRMANQAAQSSNPQTAQQLAAYIQDDTLREACAVKIAAIQGSKLHAIEALAHFNQWHTPEQQVSFAVGVLGRIDGLLIEKPETHSKSYDSRLELSQFEKDLDTSKKETLIFKSMWLQGRPEAKPENYELSQSHLAS